MSKVFFLGAPHRTLFDNSLSTRALMDRTGNNTGNLLIGHALIKQLDIEKYSRNQRLEKQQIEEEFDYIAIAAANFLHIGFDFGYLADFIEKVNLPCMMVGVGAQAQTYTFDITLPEGTMRFLKIVSERSVSIGARGQYTAEFLDKLGIKNVRITGCPSFFWNCIPTLKIRKRPLRDDFRVAISISRNVVKHSSHPQKMQQAENHLVAEAIRLDADYIVQNEYEEAILARGKQDEISDKLLERILPYYSMIEDKDSVAKFFREKSRIYFDIPIWSEAIKQYDFVIGTRFHGSMIALQNGIPATIITHDTRTREMCELFRIPYFSVEDDVEQSIESIYEQLNFTEMISNYESLYKNYIEFLNENSIPHVLRSI